MSSRIITVRAHREDGRDSDSDNDETRRPELAAEIHKAAREIAAHWVLHTKSGQMIETPVAQRAIRYKSPRRPGYIEIVWMSRPQLFYPVQGMYDFGIDASGALYDRVYRRSMDFSKEIRIWVPMDDVAASRYSTGVLDTYLLPYLNDMAHH